MTRSFKYDNWKVLAVAGMITFGAQQIAGSSLLAVEAGSASVKGSFAFYYASRLTDEELAWLKRFGIVVTANVVPSRQIVALRQSHSKLFFYRWLTGFYLDAKHAKAGDGSWESFVRHSRPKWLLNPSKPHAGPDERGRAYYYDPAHGDFRIHWARRLARDLQRSSYDGVFFDLVGQGSVPPELLDVYNARHPGLNYDQALSGLLRSLKQLRPKTLLFTNQGYRAPHIYLPAADYDLSESLMTSYAWGEPVELFVEGEGLIQARETFYRPWKELKPIVDAMDADIRRYNPALKILHLNYANPMYQPTGGTERGQNRNYPVYRKSVDKPAIYYGYAAAKLWGHDSYTGAPEGLRFSRDEIYFVDLGKPLGERYEEAAGLVRRYYERGLVVVSASDRSVTADVGSAWLPQGATGLWDCYEEKPIAGFEVTIEPTVYPASGRSYPAGRVYLYRE